MTLGAILLMTYITLFFGFGCVLVIHDTIRQVKKDKRRKIKHRAA